MMRAGWIIGHWKRCANARQMVAKLIKDKIKITLNLVSVGRLLAQLSGTPRAIVRFENEKTVRAGSDYIWTLPLRQL
jgi:hypothetical protein